MKTAVLLYRCRLCGQTFEGVGANESIIHTALVQLCTDEYVGDGKSLPAMRHDLHHHKDGAIGFGELIGMVEET